MRSYTFSSDRPCVLSLKANWPSRIPLVQDLLAQRKQLKALVVKATIFLILFGSLDRLAAGFLLKGLERSYGLDVPAKILCVGDSHTALGIDKTMLENELGVPVAKYARNGANLADRLVMIRQYLERQPSSVQVLVYDVSALTFAGEGLSQNSYTLFYPFMDSHPVDAYVRERAAAVDYYIRHIAKLRRFDLEACNLGLRGWMRMWTNLKYGMVNIEQLKKQIVSGQVRRIFFDEEPIDFFRKTLQLASDSGIHVVLLYLPCVDVYNQAEPAKYEHAIHLLKQFSANVKGATFLDYNPFFEHRHDLFYDHIHLNPQGQKLVSERLARDLKAILGPIDFETGP